jgi:hypothetical protein
MTVSETTTMLGRSSQILQSLLTEKGDSTALPNIGIEMSSKFATSRSYGEWARAALKFTTWQDPEKRFIEDDF